MYHKIILSLVPHLIISLVILHSVHFDIARRFLLLGDRWRCISRCGCRYIVVGAGVVEWVAEVVHVNVGLRC